MKKLTALLLALTMPLLANAASEPNIDPEVKKYVDAQILTVANDTVAFLDVNDTGYDRMTDGYTTMSASIEEIKPYANGSEVTLEIINWMGVALTGVRFRASVGNFGSLPIPQKEVSLPRIDAGSAAKLTIRFSEKPGSFNTVGLLYLGSDGVHYRGAK